MRKIIVGIVIIAVGAVVGLFVLLRKNTASRVSEKVNMVSPTPSAAASGQSTSATVANELFLSVSTPLDGATVTTTTVAVRGMTAPRADVFINELEIRADAAGNFSGTLTLDEGENFIIVMVNDESGNVAEKYLTVYYSEAQ